MSFSVSSFRFSSIFFQITKSHIYVKREKGENDDVRERERLKSVRYKFDKEGTKQ